MGIYVKNPGAYPAVVSRIGTMFEVKFVDLPNCVAAGRSAQEAENNAKSALGTYISTLSKLRCLPPAPTANFAGDSNTRDRYVTYLESPAPSLPGIVKKH